VVLGHLPSFEGWKSFGNYRRAASVRAGGRCRDDFAGRRRIIGPRSVSGRTDPVGNGSDLHFKRPAVGAFVGVVFLLHHRAGWISIHSSQIRWGTALDHAAPGRNSVWLHWRAGKSRYEKNGGGGGVSNQRKPCQTR